MRGVGECAKRARRPLGAQLEGLGFEWGLPDVGSRAKMAAGASYDQQWLQGLMRWLAKLLLLQLVLLLRQTRSGIHCSNGGSLQLQLLHYTSKVYHPARERDVSDSQGGFLNERSLRVSRVSSASKKSTERISHERRQRVARLRIVQLD
jgi:hypothetical protein